MSQNLTYLTTTNELASVADAIRTAGTTTEPLTFPSGFVSAIGNLGGGGTDSQPSDNSIIFSDYVNAAGNQFTFMKPTKATIKGSADMFNRTDVDAMAQVFADSSFLAGLNTVIYDITGTITRIPANYAINNINFPYPPQSVLDTVTFIGDNAFYQHKANQSGSETLVLPNIQTIGLNAFNRNTPLTSLTIGTYGNSNLQSFGQNAFRYCSNLTTINILEKPSSYNNTAFRDVNSSCVMNVVWSEGEVSGFPGTYYPGTVNYDYVPPQS